MGKKMITILRRFFMLNWPYELLAAKQQKMKTAAKSQYFSDPTQSHNHVTIAISKILLY